MSTMSRALAALPGAVAVAATALVALPTPASALSCVHPSDWYPEAKHVFVGRIADVRGDGIQLEVREVWQGPDLAERVWLDRDPAMDMWFPFSVHGRIPDGYSSPQEYVVAAQADLVLGPCSLAEVGGDTYGVDGASSPRPPVAPEEPPEETSTAPSSGAAGEPGETSQTSAGAPLAAGSVGVVGLGALGALWWRRRSS